MLLLLLWIEMKIVIFLWTEGKGGSEEQTAGSLLPMTGLVEETMKVQHSSCPSVNILNSNLS
jgi:hypothetical protein